MSWQPLQEEPSSPLSSVPPSSPSSDSDLSDVSDSYLSTLSKEVYPSRSLTQRAYPSPTSSKRSSATGSPAPDNMTPPPSNDDDDRPRKKRKITDPKERTTARLDLRREPTPADKPQLDRLLKTLHKKRKIVVIAGAGISVSAGIPDFRSSTGLFKTLRKEHKRISTGKDLFDASVYQDDTSTSSFHDMVRNLSQQTKNAEPTAFHHLLATLADEKRLLRLYTQNVDGIDVALEPLRTEAPLPKKGPWPKTVQLHGSLDKMVCSKCQETSPFDADKFNGPEPPACPTCLENDSVRKVAEKRSHGIGRLRPRMVLYNEHNPDDEAIGSCVSADLRTRPDAVIVVGTTLKVPGVRRIVREMCATVRDRRDGMNIWINNDPEPMGKDLADLWDLVIQGPCDEVARHAAMQRWNDPAVYKEVTQDQIPKHKPPVVIGTPKTVRTLQGLTPVQSPHMHPQDPMKRDVEDEPVSPSKNAAKRKLADAKPNAFEKLDAKPLAKVPKKSQPRSKKAPGKSTKSKAKKDAAQNTTKINTSFKVSKNVTAGGAKAKGLDIVPSKYVAVDKPTAAAAEVDTIHVGRANAPSTPRKGGAQVTTFKLEHRCMVPISTSDSRCNQSPSRPEVEGFTPVKHTPSRTPDEQIWEEIASKLPALASSPSESRPSTATSLEKMSFTNILN
jgi:NAD-dependent histone deacetylase SIR2